LLVTRVRAAALLKRTLIFVHRWMGVALSVIFLLWFVSGIVMMYWTYPSVTTADRLQREPVLDPSRIKLSASEAAAVLGDANPGQAQLTSFDDRPVYRFGGGGRRGGRGGGMVFADDGTVPEVSPATADRVASAWAGRPLAEAKKEAVDEIDQWTVGGAWGSRPLHKYSWSDGQEVYVSDRTADVVQYTTPESRFWAYLGAIPHWMYFTPIRKHQPQWFSLVVYSSLIGTVSAIVGIVIAVWLYSPRKRYRHAGAPTSIPYTSWKRWHTIAGLLFGVVTTTWAFSGLLSMGPFPIINKLTDLTVPVPEAPRGAVNADGNGGGSAAARPGGRGRGGPNIAAALRGRGGADLDRFADKHPRDAIRSVEGFGVKELELTSFAGKPLYMAVDGEGRTRVIPVDGPPRDGFDQQEVMGIVRAAAGGNLAELRVMDEYDAYYLDRRGERPLPVIYARTNDAIGTRFYIDPKTARVVGNYSARGWVNRWLYHGLHSLDFPWLYKYRPLWDIVVITLMLGGTALCLTSIVLTWRVVARKIAAIVRPRFTPSNEDLVLELER
jgi:hypothetical protein